MRKSTKNLRNAAKRHLKEHGHLKKTLEKPFHPERLFEFFLGTLVVGLLTLVIFFNWDKITQQFSQWAAPSPEEIQEQAEEKQKEEVLAGIKGYELGIKAGQIFSEQAAMEHQQVLQNLAPTGYRAGVGLIEVLNHPAKQTDEERRQGFLKAMLFSKQLGTGMTVRENPAQSRFLQTILWSQYLGEKDNNITNTLEEDTTLLSKIQNAVEVDVFAYLSQSVNRADSLDDYVNLLKTLSETTQKRLLEIQAQLDFLAADFESQEVTITTTEETFFENLGEFDGSKANQDLAEFITLTQQQSEIKAKVGAYQQLQKYYTFYLPQLDNRIRTIEANREPLIAGVRVVEVENMALPLIVEEE